MYASLVRYSLHSALGRSSCLIIVCCVGGLLRTCQPAMGRLHNAACNKVRMIIVRQLAVGIDKFMYKAVNEELDWWFN